MDSGVGTTHLTVATANYVANEWGIPAAVVELASRSCIRHLDTERSGAAYFVEDGVGYYPHVMSGRLPMLLNGDYSYLIMDLGSAESEWQEFLRCDLRYLVASLSPWRIDQAEKFMVMHTQPDGMEHMHQKYFTALLTVTGNVYEKKRFQQLYHVPVRSVPFMADPFRLDKDQLAFFQELL